MIKDLENMQRQAFQLTINNPQEKGLTHEIIIKRLTTKLKTADYVAMADEQGNTYHTHVYIHCRSRVRFGTVKKAIPEAHIEIARGTVSENVDYIRKEGKWKGTDKAKTSVVGTFQEWGCKPSDSAGKRRDMTELFQMIQDGMSNYEIIASNQDYIAQLDTIDRLRTTVLTEKYKNDDRKDLRVIYIYGETGTGKTSGVLKAHGASNVYRVTDYKHPFDGYNCQPVICFDEFRSSLPISAMLNYCDIYPIELPARYNNKFACYETVYIISNWSLEQQYLEAQYSDRESWLAFLRRIHEVRVYKATGIHEYKSVKDYFNGHFPSIQNPVSPHATPQISDEEFNRLMGK